MYLSSTVRSFDSLITYIHINGLQITNLSCFSIYYFTRIYDFRNITQLYKKNHVCHEK